MTPLTNKNRLSARCPNLVKEWHPSNPFTPHDVSYNSGKTVKWRCLEKEHIWNVSIRDRTRDDTGCPYCSGRRLCKGNSLAILRPDLAKELHPNNAFKATEVTTRSCKIALWVCSKNNAHQWHAKVNKRVNRSKCPYCRGRKVSTDNCVAALRSDLAKEWHSSNTIRPTECTLGCRDIITWQCIKGHPIWKTAVKCRTSKKKNSGCPYCFDERRGNSQRLSIEKFIERARIIWGDRYVYSNFRYKNMFTKGIIICLHHGQFRQTPHEHLYKNAPNGCPRCGIASAHTTAMHQKRIRTRMRRKYMISENEEFTQADLLRALQTHA